MIKVAWVMIVACFHDGSLNFSEINYLDSQEQCESYALNQLDQWKQLGIPLSAMNYSCIQVVVPENKK